MPPPGLYILVFAMGFLLFTRIVDVCIVGFWEREGAWPRWQVRKEKTDHVEDEVGGGDNVEYVKLPMPTTLRGRLAYTVDNLVSPRGESLFKDCSWEWTTKSVREYRPRSLAAFLRSAIQHAVITLLLFDITELILHRVRWNLRSPHPITSLPIPRQIFYTFIMGIFVRTGVDLPFIFRGLFLAPIFNPTSFPPLFFSTPLRSTSLSDFWSIKWHSQFRRTFERLSLPTLWMVDRYARHLHPHTITFIRTFSVFFFSTIYHLGVAYSVPPQSHIVRRILEPGQIKFFLSQPIGLSLERVVVFPLTAGMPQQRKILIRRLYLWVWIIWTGRWFCDGYVLIGQFDGRAMGFSPAANLLDWWKSPSKTGIS
ncbi:hypothetical protein FRB96_007048 [Tulasnella sp. 330]|nr:hypothetical protein FRB96_007048 [Tulasnella sp. 330]